jgi:hypothetical protein
MDKYLTHSRRKEDNLIILEIRKNSDVEFLNINTNEKKTKTVSSDTLTLSRNTIYSLHITNKTLSLDKSTMIKVPGEINEKLEILNIENGYVILIPRINIYTVKDGQELGFII